MNHHYSTRSLAPSLAGFVILLLSFLFLGPGCFYNSALEDVSCDTSDDCPGTSFCEGGFCVDDALDAGDGDVEPTCPENQLFCPDVGECVDTQVNPNHCGECGLRCGDEESCIDGICQVACGDDMVFCQSVGQCRDINSNPMHCGGCDDSACADGQVCLSGECQLSCGDSHELCGDICIRTDIDPNHCGACDDSACDEGEFCVEGECKLECGPGLVEDDNGLCRNPATDPDFCGTEHLDCSGIPNGFSVCIDGECGTQCNSQHMDCGGSCVPVASGQCSPGDSCFGPQDCESGVCSGGICQAPTCNDNVKNANETDVDCGGPECPACDIGSGCIQSSDCESDACLEEFCVECLTADHCDGQNMVCSTDNQCVCEDSRTTAEICTAAGAACGVVADACGVSVTCANTCGTGEVCKGDTNACVDCTNPSHCAPGETCNDENTCVQCITNGDCTGCQICSNGQCIDDDNSCSGCQSCGDGVCADDHENCGGPDGYCNAAQCVECTIHSHCTTTEKPVCSQDSFECVGCFNDGHCEHVCDLDDNVCVECNDQHDCLSGEHCNEDQMCVDCTDDGHCSAPKGICNLDSYLCVQCNDDDDCTDPSDGSATCDENHTCQIACDTGFEECSGSCIDTQGDDPTNCGGCSQTCSGTCSNGCCDDDSCANNDG